MSNRRLMWIAYKLARRNARYRTKEPLKVTDTRGTDTTNFAVWFLAIFGALFLVLPIAAASSVHSAGLMILLSLPATVCVICIFWAITTRESRAYRLINQVVTKINLGDETSRFDDVKYHGGMPSRLAKGKVLVSVRKKGMVLANAEYAHGLKFWAIKWVAQTDDHVDISVEQPDKAYDFALSMVTDQERKDFIKAVQIGIDASREEREKNSRSKWSQPVHDPEEFEQQVAEVFRRYGFKVVETPYQGDHGVDLKVIKPDEYAIVQCKRYKDKVGEPIVRDFFGAMQHEGADIGYIITTGGFSEPAYAWSKGKRIILVDGPAFQKMLDETMGSPV